MKLLGAEIGPPSTDTGQVALTMGGALLFGVAAVGFALGSEGTVWRGLTWAAAWSAVGWFLGFLFGIPRYLSTDTARRPAPAPGESPKAADAKRLRETARQAAGAADAAAADPAVDAATRAGLADAAAEADRAARRAEDAAAAEAATSPGGGGGAARADAAAPGGSSLTVNTNLEQISDWLTKIIVGVSLVESQALLDHMRHAAVVMARSMTAADAAAGSAAASAAALGSMQSFAFAVMLYFLATGLLGSYLLTRLFLQKALDEAAKT